MNEIIKYTKDIFVGMYEMFQEKSHYVREMLFDQTYYYGALSLPMVLVVSFFMGLTMTLQLILALSDKGTEVIAGGLVMAPVSKELGPVIMAIITAGRIGSSMTAELGSMNTTDQLDSLRLMAVNPIKYLVVPRILASVIMLPVLTILFIVTTGIGSFLMAVYGYGIAWGSYIQYLADMVNIHDVIGGLVKSIFFGFIVAYIACYKGVFLKGRSDEIGTATTDSVAFSIVAVLIMNLLLSYIIFA